MLGIAVASSVAVVSNKGWLLPAAGLDFDGPVTVTKADAKTDTPTCEMLSVTPGVRVLVLGIAASSLVVVTNDGWLLSTSREVLACPVTETGDDVETDVST